MNGYLEIPNQAVLEVIDPTVKGKPLAALPGPDKGWVTPEDTDLIDYVELAKALPTPAVVRKQGQFLSMGLP